MKRYRSAPSLLAFISLITALLCSCYGNNTSMSASRSQAVKDSVLQLADLTAKDISARGPIAWLDHFEDSPDFFMASDGILAFKNYQTADTFIKDTLVKAISKINLRWSAIRIDPLSPEIATMAASFHEDISYQSGKITPYDGYFTGTAHETEKRWKFRNAHWSLRHGK